MLNANSSTGTVTTLGPGLTVGSLSMPITATSSSSLLAQPQQATSVQHQRDRDRQRERERNRRQRDTQSSLTGAVAGQLLFTDSPIKHAPSDEVSNKIKSTLGNFNEFATLMNRLNQNDQHLTMYGISTRDLNKQKVEAIFSEMKTPIQPITGLDEIEYLASLEASASGGPNSHASSRSTPPPPPSYLTTISTTSVSAPATTTLPRHTQPALSSSCTTNSRPSSSSKMCNTNNIHSANDTQNRKTTTTTTLPYQNLIAAVSPPLLAHSPNMLSSSSSSRPNVIDDDLDLSEDDDDEEMAPAKDDNKVNMTSGDRKRKQSKSSCEDNQSDHGRGDDSSSEESSDSDSSSSSESDEDDSDSSEDGSDENMLKKKGRKTDGHTVIQNGKNKVTGLSSDDDDAHERETSFNSKTRKELNKVSPPNKDVDEFDLGRFIDGSETIKAEDENNHRRHSSDMEEGELDEDDDDDSSMSSHSEKPRRSSALLDHGAQLKTMKQSKKPPLLPLPSLLSTKRLSPIPHMSKALIAGNNGSAHSTRTSSPPAHDLFESSGRSRSATTTTRPHSSNGQRSSSPPAMVNNYLKNNTLIDRTNHKEEQQELEDALAAVQWKDTIGGSVKMRHKSDPVKDQDKNVVSENKFKPMKACEPSKSKKHSTSLSKATNGSKKSSKSLSLSKMAIDDSPSNNLDLDRDFAVKVKISNIRLPSSLSKANRERKAKTTISKLDQDKESTKAAVKSSKSTIEAKLKDKTAKLTNGKNRKETSILEKAATQSDKKTGKLTSSTRSISPAKHALNAAKIVTDLPSINNFGPIPKKAKAGCSEWTTSRSSNVAATVSTAVTTSVVSPGAAAHSSSSSSVPATLKAPSPLVASMTRSPQLAASTCTATPNHHIQFASEHDAAPRAKKLKRNADRETDRYHQMALYIEAVLYFIHSGVLMEKKAEPDFEGAFKMYKDTLSFLKTITHKFTKSPVKQNSEKQKELDVKLTSLSLRCQALLLQKLSRMRQKELYENREAISAFLSEANVQSALQQATNTPTSNESVSVPASTLLTISKQLQYLQQFQNSQDLWLKADQMTEKVPAVKDYFQSLVVDGQLAQLHYMCTFEQLFEYGIKAIRGMATSEAAGCS